MAINYNPRIVTDGLVLALDAGNTKSYPGSGTIWYDRASANTGTLTNGPTYSSGNGGSIVFDGVNDFINCGSGLALSGSWTLCAFAKPTAVSRTGILLQRSGDVNTGYLQNYGIYQQNNNKFYCGTSADSYKFASSTTTVTSNTWYYVTGLYDSTSKVLSIYIKIGRAHV